MSATVRKTVLYILQCAVRNGKRYPLAAAAITENANRCLNEPTTVECVRATLGELEDLGLVRRKASILDPEELTWLVTTSGLNESTL